MEPETTMTLPYIDEYNKFIRDYKSGTVNGEEVGQVISRMAQYFSEYNLKLVLCEKKLFLVARDIESRVDENTGKAITSSKAVGVVNATEEHFEADMLKAHVANIEQFINALKALQKGVLNEYSHSGL